MFELARRSRTIWSDEADGSRALSLSTTTMLFVSAFASLLGRVDFDVSVSRKRSCCCCCGDSDGARSLAVASAMMAGPRRSDVRDPRDSREKRRRVDRLVMLEETATPILPRFLFFALFIVAYAICFGFFSRQCKSATTWRACVYVCVCVPLTLRVCAVGDMKHRRRSTRRCALRVEGSYGGCVYVCAAAPQDK